MERIDLSRFLLYFEPEPNGKRLKPMDDELTRIMQHALKQSERGLANYSNLKSNGDFTRTNKGWRGVHYTECGEHSTNQDYLLENGLITNSLAVFYLQHYRRNIPRSEIKKVIDLYLFYHLDKNQHRVDLVRKHYLFFPWILKVRYWLIFRLIPYRRFFSGLPQCRPCCG